MKNKLFKIVKIFILITFVFIIGLYKNNVDMQIHNSDISKTVDLDKMSLKANELQYDDLYGAKESYTGDLTSYVYNCPACTGELYCNWRYDLSHGVTTYVDKTYGEVAIVASSSNLPCGSIIRFESKRISEEPVYAIVLDRGVLGTAIDFLTDTEDHANYIGRSKITYDVIRIGY